MNGVFPVHRIVKRLVQGILRPLGLEVRRIDDRLLADPFWLQTQLIKKEKPLIFDVGANTGQTCETYLQLIPSCTIHAFEPFPESFTELQTRFGTRPQVKLNQLAISDAEGMVSMHANTSNATNSLLPTDPRSAEAWGTNVLETQSVIQIPSTTIDAYCKAHEIEIIDILKLDIQGAELQALRGARSMLESGRVGLIYMELIFAATYQNQPTFEEYLEYMHNVGYAMLDIYNPHRNGFQLLQADIIWLKKK